MRHIFSTEVSLLGRSDSVALRPLAGGTFMGVSHARKRSSALSGRLTEEFASGIEP